MATSEIKEWYVRGKNDSNNTFMVVVCDEFDMDDYPVYIDKTEDIHARVREINHKNMQRIMEVYDFSLDMESQMNTHRAGLQYFS